MWMAQASDNACLRTELLQVFITDLSVKNFDGRVGIEMDVFTQVNFGKAATC
jgi:hypothetical protein